MTELLPLTISHALEEELEALRPGANFPKLSHEWTFQPNEVNAAAVMDRILNIGIGIVPEDAYWFIYSKILNLKQPVEQILGQLISAGLLPREALASQMITESTRNMYDQVSRASTPVPTDIERVNRTILEELFPYEIRRAADRHLRHTVQLFHTMDVSALCLSGGGIRSATFALGVLQGLARAGDSLEEVDYLSTVSGGGYIGGWLSRWIFSEDGKRTEIFRQLRSTTSQVLSPEPEAVRWLREYTNYLAPRFKLFSRDTWTVIVTWARNVGINWLVYLPFIAAVLLLPRLLVAACAGARHGYRFFWLGASAVLAVGAIALIGGNRPAVTAARSPGRLALISIAAGCAIAAAIAFTLFWSTMRYDNVALAAFVIAGVAVHGVGALFQVNLPRVTFATTWRSVVATIMSGACGGLALGLFCRIPALRPPVHSLELYGMLAPAMFLMAFLAGGTVFTVLTSPQANDEIREYWSRVNASLILFGLLIAVISAVSIYGPVLIAMAPKATVAAGGITGLVGMLLGASGMSPAQRREERTHTYIDRITTIVVPIFVLILLSAISWGVSLVLQHTWRGEFPAAVERRVPSHIELTARVNGSPVDVHVAADADSGWPLPARDHFTVLEQTSVSTIVSAIVMSVIFVLIVSRFVDVNKFSMHALYQMRLVRAYLGASNKWRNADSFTGFDENDNILLSELAVRKPLQKPFHVINMALNLVRGKRLAWQQRKASTFTATPLHCGNWRLGYRDTREYGGTVRRPGLDLGTAITISGAAASPNMGYHSSPLLSFLLAMFNVRLGVWRGNPGVAGAQRKWYDVFGNLPAWRRDSPKLSLGHQLAEALGWTDDDHQYVYLSDGGHFENLGVYEMVLRRCRYIIVSDAGADHDVELEDLGNAVRKIRVDLGIPVVFDRFAILSRDERKPAAHCALGTIRYSAVDSTTPEQDGRLLYIKASYYSAGPQDIRQYARRFRRFPHETTADQFFTEAQFESYRGLGEWVIQQIVQNSKPATLRDVFDAADVYVRRYKDEARW